ncbi:MAG: hypothetical protein ACP5NW_03755 [Candidatus Woesearchaeota archaeon]
MGLFRDQVNIETIEKACPICHSDVKGNDAYLYFCKRCNILYKKEELVITKEAVEDKVIKKIVDRFEKDKDKIQIEQQAIPTKELTGKKQVILEDIKKTRKYYISKKSNILHVSNCPYGKNIKKENKIILKNLEGTEKLKKCRCFTEQ